MSLQEQSQEVTAEFARIRGAFAASAHFRSLAAEDLDALAALGKLRRLAEGTVAVRAGQRQETFWLVVSGCLRLSSVSAGGSEFVYAMLGPGGYFGLGSMLHARGTPTDARAAGATTVAALDYGRLIALLDERPRLWRHFSALLNRRLTIALGILRDMSVAPLQQRIVRRLLGQASSSGADLATVKPIELRLSQADLGRMLGASRSRVNGELKHMEKDGLIDVRYRTISLLQVAKLREIAGAEVCAF